MKPIILLDNTNHVVRCFDTYIQANHYRMMYNRPDWNIKSINNNYSYYT